jgi:hypothetical protein
MNNQTLNQEEYTTWLRILYNETMKLYLHEDNISQTRNTLFLSIQSGLIAVLAAITPSLLVIDPVRIIIEASSIDLFIFGLIMSLFSVVSLLILENWKAVNKAGHAHLKLRWAVIKRIEYAAHIPEEVCPATIEDAWIKFSNNPENKESKFIPFPDVPELCDIKLDQKQKIGGWRSTEELMKIFSCLWFTLGILGLLLLILPNLNMLFM